MIKVRNLLIVNVVMETFGHKNLGLAIWPNPNRIQIWTACPKTTRYSNRIWHSTPFN